MGRLSTSSSDSTPAGGTWRYCLVFGILVVAVIALGVRMAVLPYLHGEIARKLNERQQSRTIPLPARVGSIYAVSGDRQVPMALSYQVATCFADPSLIPDDQLMEVASQVGDALGVDPIEIQNTIMLLRDRQYAKLKEAPYREITPAQVEAIRKLKLRSIGIEHEWRRSYPAFGLAATVIGFRRPNGDAGGGLELSMEASLQAQQGKRVVKIDSRRRAIRRIYSKSCSPRDGSHVYVTIEPIIQGFLQKAIKESIDQYGGEKTWGTGVVVDPYTGRILAMCSVPSFDPNDYNRKGSSRVNRAITVPFEPGSVAKPLFAAAAVNEGVATYKTMIFCHNGTYIARKGGRITDHGQSYGQLSVEDGIVHSSNILMAKIGELLGNKRLHKYAKAYGLGIKTGLRLPGESRGIIRPLAKWDGYSLRRIPFGQEMSTTALQMTMAFAALANGGVLYKPYIVDRIEDPTGKVVYRARKHRIRRVLRAEVAAETLKVLEQVVVRGTGKNCQMAKWTSFGKTGTAQIPGPGGYVDDAYTGSFAGGAPVSNPRLVCLISIYWPERDKGYYGSMVAAPFVKKVLAQSLEYLKVPADRP